MMNQKQVTKVIKLLKKIDISFDKGLSNNEVTKVEHEFKINLPNDLKLLLQTELPVSTGFVNWRLGINSKKEKKEIENRLNWPKEGLLFDIKNNSFWLNDWGEKPLKHELQKEIVISELAKQPKLIPIYSHRYIPNIPNEVGNPIFSVYQMDIIHYGFNLLDYFANEFGFELSKTFNIISEPKKIKFWSDMVDLNNKLNE